MDCIGLSSDENGSQKEMEFVKCEKANNEDKQQAEVSNAECCDNTQIADEFSDDESNSEQPQLEQKPSKKLTYRQTLSLRYLSEPFDSLEDKKLFEMPLKEYLKQPRKNDRGKSLKELLPNLTIVEDSTRIILWRGSVVDLSVDAIVNAANSSLLGGGGVDGAIHSNAGFDLRRECSTHEECDVGEAIITKGYHLPSKAVIHTVGPVLDWKGRTRPEKLRQCYRSCLSLCEEYQIKSVAFCCISCGVYGYPVEEAAPLALEEVKLHLRRMKEKHQVTRMEEDPREKERKGEMIDDEVKMKENEKEEKCDEKSNSSSPSPQPQASSSSSSSPYSTSVSSSSPSTSSSSDDAKSSSSSSSDSDSKSDFSSSSKTKEASSSLTDIVFVVFTRSEWQAYQNVFEKEATLRRNGFAAKKKQHHKKNDEEDEEDEEDDDNFHSGGHSSKGNRTITSFFHRKTW
ncbi:putative O-acetyl-ADP-ribose deacetylase [Monocercomonoides exilis]|uniref:putative O-acetyl-ADP-ribose deacetylase n=1 Tax=Monocercomonoides exilis TaxID=2049356 RepID=UPI00355A357C|nr:putative O-acetyl-ADP-ribose deacetylase [Monocercomonoides exilis]|eukprot:MONOS_9089.1-p1 / transcript=MONOS_9089.1 / gene=MONOS_9089 / organism=Monocercomonoides_exilis_PA203 / gene_product=MACRO domain-containing protein 2 / transcript_product=MACRO domain-containing protein 2 / location=Mono_scaffold00364:3692-5062(+) / protein_length=456 / sequence_SO=supercontig / SO=protein_coding / is_pseudo=false